LEHVICIAIFSTFPLKSSFLSTLFKHFMEDTLTKAGKSPSAVQGVGCAGFLRRYAGHIFPSWPIGASWHSVRLPQC
jgi:hypothetical protein